jgi:hypothetical protein
MEDDKKLCDMGHFFKSISNVLDYFSFLFSITITKKYKQKNNNGYLIEWK